MPGSRPQALAHSLWHLSILEESSGELVGFVRATVISPSTRTSGTSQRALPGPGRVADRAGPPSPAAEGLPGCSLGVRLSDGGRIASVLRVCDRPEWNPSHGPEASITSDLI